MIVSGYIVDVIQNKIFPGEVEIRNGYISKIKETTSCDDVYICPGLIDAHVHIESSMTVPSRFAQMVVPHGTVAVVSDPHEIANVCGKEGVKFMMEDAKTVPMKSFFGVPSCVPATPFETSGSELSAIEVNELFDEGAGFLAEMMNFPGVISGEEFVMSKIQIALSRGKKIDGHAPGIVGSDLRKYVEAGISTDHECSSLKEAVEKIELGMTIQIREGSAARNFESLWTLIRDYPDKVMLCTDDSHPDLILEEGHIDRLIRRGLKKGLSIFDLYKAALINPVKYYQLNVGMLKEGDPADLIVINNLEDFNVIRTIIDGKEVASNGQANFKLSPIKPINQFNCSELSLKQLEIRLPEDKSKVQVIDAFDGELLTKKSIWKPIVGKDRVISPDVDQDILKVVVLNRYSDAPPVIGFIRNFGLKYGAIGGSIAHDSHNIIAVGVNDLALLNVINEVIKYKGAMAAADNDNVVSLPLDVAGLMSMNSGELVAEKYQELNRIAKKMGAKMKAPFMTIAFMSLLVIPDLKIGDKGLFDVTTFSFTDLFID